MLPGLPGSPSAPDPPWKDQKGQPRPACPGGTSDPTTHISTHVPPDGSLAAHAWQGQRTVTVTSEDQFPGGLSSGPAPKSVGWKVKTQTRQQRLGPGVRAHTPSLSPQHFLWR